MHEKIWCSIIWHSWNICIHQRERESLSSKWNNDVCKRPPVQWQHIFGRKEQSKFLQKNKKSLSNFTSQFSAVQACVCVGFGDLRRSPSASHHPKRKKTYMLCKLLIPCDWFWPKIILKIMEDHQWPWRCCRCVQMVEPWHVLHFSKFRFDTVGRTPRIERATGIFIKI